MDEQEITGMLNALQRGEVAPPQLLEAVYAELHILARAQMRNERADHTLQPTALVHEAYLKLTGGEVSWANRRHFFGAAAESMRRILVEQARRRARQKRGGDRRREAIVLHELPGVTLPDAKLLSLHEALSDFEKEEPAKAELVKLRYFAGLDEQEAAMALDISRSTASRWWSYAKAWLFERMGGPD